MIWLYLSALIFGAAFVVPMVLGGLDFGADAELDFDAGDADFDVDGADLDTEFDADGFGSAVGDFALSLLSFRSIVFFLTFFGLSGLLFTFVNTNVVVGLLASVGLGLTASVANAALFGYLMQHKFDSSLTNSELTGRPATVVVPLGPGRKGKIRIDIAGQPQYMVAEPFNSSSEVCNVGDSVVVVEIENATALVAPLLELEGEEL